MTFRPLLLAAALVSFGMPAFAQTNPPQLPAPSGNTTGQTATQPASPGQGNGSEAGMSTPATPPAGNGRQVDSAFSNLKVGPDGRAPLTQPAGALAPGMRAPSQPPAGTP